MTDNFEKTSVGALNAMALIMAQVLVNRGLTQAQATNIVNEILDTTTKVITGEMKAIISEDKHNG